MDELDESIGQGDSKYHLEMREVDQIHNLKVWIKEDHVKGWLKRGKDKNVLFYMM